MDQQTGEPRVRGDPYRPLNDVSIQADIQGPLPTCYESEDEGMGRRRGRGKLHSALYSKTDIREQYCITERQLHGLDELNNHHQHPGLFGCLSSYQIRDSSCSSRSPNLLTVCVGRKVPSDENLAEMRPVTRYWPPPPPPLYHHRDLYPPPLPPPPWLLEEDPDPMRMERLRLMRGLHPHEYDLFGCPRRYLSYSTEFLYGGGRPPPEPCPAHPHLLPPPPPPPSAPPSSVTSLHSTPHRTKHVSFARSHTLQSFDDAVSFGSTSGGSITTCSQERLIDGRKTTEPQKVIVMEKAKKASMKTQATQTEVCLGRKPLPPNILTLSPRSMHKVKLVSQGAQTNGLESRRLTKSYSEVGGKNGVGVPPAIDIHEPLQRTQSEEPPRSPYMPPSPKEILINFEPLVVGKRRMLAKTLSEGEILEGRPLKQEVGDSGTQSDGELASSKTTIEPEPQLPIISPPPTKRLITADSQEEEFHENFIYGRYMKKVDSFEDSTEIKAVGKGTGSPFASCDSLDTKDHSDGIWNESQTTVVQADSDNTGVSCSDVSASLTPSAAVHSMTPTTKRRYQLLSQHQQRSSIDTEQLDTEDFLSEQVGPLSPRLKTDISPPVPVTVQPMVSLPVPVPERTVELSKPKIITPQKERRSEFSLSPIHRGKRKRPGARTPDSDLQHQSSSATTLSSNEAIGRSDSGRTNTDMSETSTTTEDYATATENTSEGSGSRVAEMGVITGGSFESGSSLYSLTRADATEEQQVPSSPPPVIEKIECKVNIENNRSNNGKERKKEDSSDVESSSSGSYSVDGSSDKIAQSDRSHCSSTGGYDSLSEEQVRKKSWTEEEKKRYKKSFKLELSPKAEQPESPVSFGIGAKSPNHKKSPGRTSEVRSPVSTLRKTTTQVKESQTSCIVRSPGGHETVKKDDWVVPQRKTPDDKSKVDIANGLGGHDSTDESSTEECACGKTKKPRESPRRKGGRSPTSHLRRRSVEERRSSLQAAKSPSPQSVPQDPEPSKNNRLSPHSARSPADSPQRQKGRSHIKPGVMSPESARLKALSAESLRSVSPGSDSVFYSETSTHSTCLHCGRHLQPPPQAEEPSGERGGGALEIVPAPEGFADSPRAAHKTRLYKKQEKRYRSEERRYRIHEAARAKSEERARSSHPEPKEKLRPLTRSTDASLEKLHSLHSSMDDEEDVNALNMQAWSLGAWVYLDSTFLYNRRDGSDDSEESGTKKRRDSIESTSSEKDFRRRYQNVTHRMVHRKSTLEMYKKLASKSFEADKRVMVRRVSGEFGFRIHGSRPVVVSAIEQGTPAETSGLEVGDIIISVNHVGVLDLTHSDVVKIAHGGSDTLEMEVVRTFDTSSLGRESRTGELIHGPLYRLSSSSSKNKPAWILRYFSLRDDHSLFHYKASRRGHPLGAINITDFSIVRTPDSEWPYSFQIKKKGLPSIHLAATNPADAEAWIDQLSRASKPRIYPWLSEKSLSYPPTRIKDPECAGNLSILVHHRTSSWKRRFCILKDACLYFYTDINADNALGIVCIHGYKVQSSTLSSKRYSFEIFPPEPSLLHIYFYTDTEMDKKRWLAALEYSIDHWVKVG